VVWILNKIYIINDARSALFMCNIGAVTMAAFMTNVLERVMGIEIEYSGDKLPVSESAIIMSNHVTNMDVFCLVAYQYRKGMCGHGKFMAKSSLKHVPFFGWACAMMGQVFLKRDWDKDKTRLTETFDFLLRNRLPVHLVVFNEGTRINEKNRKEMMEFARQRGIEPTQQVLLPRPKGFKAIVNHMRESHIRYIYDMTIGYPNGIIRFRDLLISSLYGRKVLINIKRIPIEDVPSQDDAMQDWVMDRFRRKDKLISSMLKEKSFEGEPKLKEPMIFRL
jgi:lysocardiolipin and lysophospholipid acyltransferase